MSTGTVQGRATTLSKLYNRGDVRLSVANGEGTAVVDGQEVYISGDDEVSLRDLGTDYPLGVVETGGDDGELVTVHANVQRTLVATAKGGALTAGAFVKPNGTVTNGIPEYVVAVTGDFAIAQVLRGGLVDTNVVLVQHYAPKLIPA